MSAPVVERQPFRYLVKSCYGPRSKSIENADESMRDSIETVSYTHLTLPTIYSV